MSPYFRRYKPAILLALLLCFLVTFIYKYSCSDLSLEEVRLLPEPERLSLNISSHDFHLYPQSRSAIEYNRIQIDHIEQIMFLSPKHKQDDNIRSIPLSYSETAFRSAPFPVIWLDHQGDVRWNYPAQHDALNYLLEKQFPNNNISTCLTRQLFLLEQWPMGFFSRHHCLIEHFGQTLYSPSMVLLIPRRFSVSNAGKDDFLNEGILRYYQSISLCQSHLNHPQLKQLRDDIQSSGGLSNRKTITNVHQLLDHDEQTVRYKYSHDIWKYGYDHVPHRRWLFDRNRVEIKQIVTYHSPINVLIDHSNEHIYYDPNTPFNLTQWHSRNSPQGYPSDVLKGTTTNFSIEDRIFSSFLRYMFLLFISPLAPRIQTSAKLLAHHWSEYLSDKHNLPYDQALSKLAAIFIRRGDKMPEDSFWQKHQHWRNISMYVKGLIDEEKHRKIDYTAIFIVTDDATVMSSIQEYARDGLTTTNKDESYARQYLHNREILYNIFAPQSCFDPFSRIGFDQFLVNVQFLADYASLVVGHTDSNVGRYIEEIIYVNRQHNSNVQTRTHVINAPDVLE